MKRTLLGVFAHPDDESFGTGGTLARYARDGVDVHIAIATDGAAGSVAKGYEDARAQLVAVRTQELDAAIEVLEATLHRLGYRDSGMTGDPSNAHPDAWINADEEIAIGRIVKLIRTYRPQVVITHDETGGYFHPDHIMCYRMTTAAFHAAGDPTQYPDIGPAPYQPERLYYSARSRRWISAMVMLRRLQGQDPKRIGRNKDIDLTKLGTPPEKIHARIDIRPVWEVKREASAKHASQGGGTAFFGRLPEWLRKLIFGAETFMRAYPPVPNGYRERDLFAGVHLNGEVRT